MIPIAPYLTAFFEQHLVLERRRSEQTRDSYAYAFKLLLTYARERLKVAPSQLALEQLDAPLVRDFLMPWKQHGGMDRVPATPGWPRSSRSCTSCNTEYRPRWSRFGR